MRKQTIWNLAAVAISSLVLSTSAWADISGTVYHVGGNLLDAGNFSGITTTCVGTAVNCVDGTFTAPSVNFIVPEANGTTNPLKEFLDSGGATYSPTMPNLNNVMSNCPPANTNCYSTAIDIVGTGYFQNGQHYHIQHDDGVIMYIGGTLFIDARAPTSSELSDQVFSGTSGVYSFEVQYMATNGNPEVLQSNIPGVPDGGSTLMLLGAALLGIDTLRRKFRA